MKSIGIDIGGTSIKVGLFQQGELLQSERIEGISSLKQLDGFLRNDLIKNFATSNNFLGFGFGVPGVISNSIVMSCPNLPWLEDINIKEFVTSIYPKSLCKIDNDANVAALGEALYGSGKNYTSFAFLTIGTGIGGGLIIDSKIFRGPGGMAGEIGHLNANHSKICNCGSQGCIEAIASASSMEQEAKSLGMTTNSLPNLITQAMSGDNKSKIIFEKSGEAMGHALSQINLLTDIRTFIFGGGGSPSLKLWLPSIIKVMEKRCFGRNPRQDFIFQEASLGNQSGMFGATSLLNNN